MDKKSYIGYRVSGMGFQAHLTLIYTGNLSERMSRQYEDMLAKHPMFDATFEVVRKNINLFGPDRDIPVVEVEVPDVLRNLRDSLIASGVRSPSEYSWNPHISLDFSNPQTIRIPRLIRLSELDVY